MLKLLLPLGIAAYLLSAMAPPAAAADPAPTGQSILVEPTAPLTLPAALFLALSANADLSAARRELQAVEASVLQAGAMPNPILEVTTEDHRRETRETTWQLSQPIELGGKRSARVQAAERGHDAATAEFHAKQADVRAAVMTVFFDVLAAQERLQVTEDAAQLAERGATAAARRVAAGKVSPVEETKARVAQSSVRLELAQAKSELTSVRKRLAALWSNPVPRFTRVDGRLDALPPLATWEDVSRRLAASPALTRARNELERRQALARLESRRRIPDVTVTLGVKRSEELGRNQAIVGLAMPLPVFDSNRGNALEAARRSDKARDELAAIEVRLDGDLAQAYERLSLARQEAESLQRDIVPGAQSAFDAAAKGFEYGKFNFLDVLDAQRTLLQARSQYLRALSEAHRAAAEIERILGEPMHASQP